MSSGLVALVAATALWAHTQADEVPVLRRVEEGNRKFEVDGIRVELQIEVNEKDIEDIRAIASQVGIRDIQKIFVGYHGVPYGVPMAIVESRPVRDGNRIARRELVVAHKYWTPWQLSTSPSTDVPGSPHMEEGLTTRGFWQADSRDLSLLDRTLVEVGDWTIEVRLDFEVPYDDAVLLLHAIREGAVVDARVGIVTEQLSVNPYGLLSDNPRTVPRIWRAANAAAGQSRRYLIEIFHGMSSGTVLHVRIVGDRVEVYQIGQWIA
jgi:hypothetical protein